MKRLLVLLTVMILCTSCTALPAEERAFVVALCVEKANGVWRVCGRIPTYQSGGGYLTVTGKGESLQSALTSMEAAAPMELALSQLRLLVLNESLARTEDLAEALRLLGERNNMRLLCAVALTDIPIETLAEALQPAAGERLSKSLDVLLESRINQGAAPEANLADVLRMGERQSPVLMALTLEGQEIRLLGGYVLTSDMILAGRLTEEETVLLSMCLGQTGELRLSLAEGDAKVREISVDTALSPDGTAARVDITLRVTDSTLTGAALEAAIAQRCLALLERLSEAGCDVLGLGRQRMAGMEDVQDWQAAQWPTCLRALSWTVSVQAQGPVE